MSTELLKARFITLRRSYSLFGSGNSVIPGTFVKLLIVIVPVGLSILATVPVAILVSSFLNKISILSPIFRLDLSISLVNNTMFEPEILSTLNLEDVL